MNLYVVNEDSPNPESWSQWSEWALVIAPDAETALSMVPANNGRCCELPLSEARVLVVMPEPNHGDDL